MTAVVPAIAEEEEDEASPGPAETAAPLPAIPLPPGHESQPDSHTDGRAASLLGRETLTGDWGGLRSKLADRGVAAEFRYTGEIFETPTGGTHRGGSYEHQLLGAVDLDFQKMLGLAGTTGHASAISVNDRGPSERNVGSALGVSNIEWKQQTRLWTAWLQQDGYGGRVSLRGGQISIDDEFDISPSAGGLLSAPFTTDPIISANLPAGVPNRQRLTLGPGHPLGAPGVRFRLAPREDIAWLTAVFSAQPASADRNGLQFRVDGGALGISELQFLQNQDGDGAGKPSAYKLGAWYDSGKFPDLKSNTPSASSGGQPRQARGNWGVYGLADRTLWQDGSGKAISVFARINLAPMNDRNTLSFYTDAGIALTGPLPGREDDRLTLGFANGIVSSGARAQDRQRGTAVHNHEAIIELAYEAQVAPWWTVTPDLQYVVSPGFGGADPASTNPMARIPNALVVGARTALSF